jgi:hypothetical protein
MKECRISYLGRNSSIFPARSLVVEGVVSVCECEGCGRKREVIKGAIPLSSLPPPFHSIIKYIYIYYVLCTIPSIVHRRAVAGTQL